MFEDDVSVDLSSVLDRKPNYANSLHSLLHLFADIIIGEAADTLPLDPFFASLYHVVDASEIR